MGSGKSTLGKKLARMLQFDFIDTDKMIEESVGKKIPEIFRQEGEPFFRKREHELLQTLSGRANVVVSAGGGMPCFEGNISLMKQLGVIVYLEAAPKLLAQRLAKSGQERPLLKGLSGEGLEATIADMLQQRECFYKQADIIMNACSLTANDVLKAIESL